MSPPNERVSKVGVAAGPLREGVASKGTAAGMSRKLIPEGVDDGVLCGVALVAGDSKEAIGTSGPKRVFIWTPEQKEKM